MCMHKYFLYFCFAEFFLVFANPSPPHPFLSKIQWSIPKLEFSDGWWGEGGAEYLLEHYNVGNVSVSKIIQIGLLKVEGKRKHGFIKKKIRRILGKVLVLEYPHASFHWLDDHF